jgi:hypothetical protein
MMFSFFKRTVVLLSLCLCVSRCFGQEVGSPAQWVPYEPSKTQLTGRIMIESKYGPPGYGEDPIRDRKVRIYVLKLRIPIGARASATYGQVESVPEIELFFRKKNGANSWSAAHRAIGTCVNVTGEIRQSQIAAEFTPLIMEVDQLSPVKDAENVGACQIK